MNDVIVAIATAKAEAAIGIIRMSGTGCINILDKVFKTKTSKSILDFENKRITYGYIYDENKEYDEVMAVYMKAPNTYTREDIVEIYTHGNYIIMNEILNLLIKKGAKPALAGEFTKRAFLNGRIDLSQAEAVMDMVSAKTLKGFDVAKNQLSGKFSKNIDKFSEKMTDLLAKIEVTIDYPDEDIEMIERDEILTELMSLNADISKILETYDTGKIIKDGIKMAIVGKPNAGKSSILNALMNEDRAIVSDIAGTTRDTIEADVNINGIKIMAIDTAGIRDTKDEIEKIGVEKSKKMFNIADVVLFVVDNNSQLTNDDLEIIENIGEKPCIICINKQDLKNNLDLVKFNNIINKKLLNYNLLNTSINDEKSIENIKNTIEKMVINSNINVKDSTIITNARHYSALYNANENIKYAINSLLKLMPIDLIEVDLQEAYKFLGEISGKTLSEDVISRIFQKFCLGK